jgi:hypothetical protein
MSNKREYRKKGGKHGKNSKRIIYTLLLISMIILIIVIIRDASLDYRSFRGHQKYLKNESIQIEEWMTPWTVLRHFTVQTEDVLKELRINETRTNLQTPILDICRREKLNCSQVIINLNKMRQ